MSQIYLDIFGGKYFGKVENGQNKCPKTENVKKCCQNASHDCIIEFYGLVAKKIIFTL